MKRVYVSIGSNVDAREHISSAIAMVEQRYGDLEFSRTYQNPAVGFDGDDFLNLVIGFDSDDSVTQLAASMREIEAVLGRDRTQPKFSSRTIDLDLLIIDNKVIEQGSIILPRDEILKYAFVLRPLSELVGQAIHPIAGKTYEALWKSFDDSSQPMTAIDISH